jgi:hypothetical protein
MLFSFFRVTSRLSIEIVSGILTVGRPVPRSRDTTVQYYFGSRHISFEGKREDPCGQPSVPPSRQLIPKDNKSRVEKRVGYGQ